MTMITIPSAVGFRVRPFRLSAMWEAWAHWLNPGYRQSMARLKEYEARKEECRAVVDSLLR